MLTQNFYFFMISYDFFIVHFCHSFCFLCFPSKYGHILTIKKAKEKNKKEPQATSVLKILTVDWPCLSVSVYCSVLKISTKVHEIYKSFFYPFFSLLI